MGQTLLPEQRPEALGPQDARARSAPSDALAVSADLSPAPVADAPHLTLPMYAERVQGRAGEPLGALLWRVLKWPVRKTLLGVSLAADALRRSSLLSRMTAVVVLLALIFVSGAIFAATRLTTAAAPTPIVRVAQPALPPLPLNVQRFLRARQRFDAKGVWATYDVAGQRALGVTEPQLQTALDQRKAAGEVITRYVYTGGYKAPDGTAHYTIEAYITQRGQTTVNTWYLDVGADGLITRLTDLTAH